MLLAFCRMNAIPKLAQLAMEEARRGDLQRAIELAKQALVQHPGDHGLMLFIGALHARRMELDEAAASFREALRIAPADPIAAIELTRALIGLGQFDEAEKLLRSQPLPGPEPARFSAAIARAYERQNRLAEAEALIAELDEPLLKAQLAYRRGEFERALELAEAAPESEDPGERSELLGRIHDRLGRSSEAFAAFAEMNRHVGLAPGVAETRAKGFRDRLAEHDRQLAKGWIEGWAAVSPTPRAPAFILSFPRSGTTLLETLLMGHDGLRVADEKPMLDTVARRVEGQHIAQLDGSQLDELRRLYFDVAAQSVPSLGDRLLIDKQPFATIEAPLIHRLFSDARLIFVERHPCDVVLSCFTARFEPNPGLLNFTTLEGAARLYDAIMSFWTRCRDLLPLTVHELRYERLVANAEGEMRALLAFLGLEWDERVLDHVATAEARRSISTPSYAQVVEPLYDRSIGRWKRYAEQMKPVLPILAPWARRLGYDV